MSTALNIIQDKFEEFVNVAAPLLHITSETEYEQALQVVEELLEQASDDPQDTRNGLIELISRAIAAYDAKDSAVMAFDQEADNIAPDVAVLRLLMSQHQLTGADLPEIGDKTLVSKILSGERNLTKQHIEKLAKRFQIDPGLFFKKI
jgi:HTH-type transcriptional regulator / antitoxin HigA